MVAGGLGRALQEFWFSGWGLDWLYARLFVDPYQWFGRINQRDVVDSVYRGAARLCRLGYGQASAAQTGQLRWYVGSMVTGAMLAVALGVWW